MGILDRILRRKPFDPNARRRFLLESGRITDGVIVDTKIDSDGRELVVFVYTLNGVDFESADVLTDEQKQNAGDYVPGAKVGIRFDPKNQYNSIVE
ncbi:MAG: hypothetical protein AB7J13_12595 [Pyrinomonadaceae bacterium]